jgi:hypothetical protein
MMIERLMIAPRAVDPGAKGADARPPSQPVRLSCKVAVSLIVLETLKNLRLPGVLRLEVLRNDEAGRVRA